MDERLEEVAVPRVECGLVRLAVHVQDAEEDAQDDGHDGQDDRRHG